MQRQRKKYLLVPVFKNPYNRVGPKKWQDWYRQVLKTIEIARELKNRNHEAIIIELSNYRPKGVWSEIATYSHAFKHLAPELEIQSYRETNDTLGQVQKSLELAEAMDAELLFISTWMQYPRVVYLADSKKINRGRKAKHYGVFGIPQPVFALIDPICIIFQPLVDILGLSPLFQRLTVHEREKGRIL